MKEESKAEQNNTENKEKEIKVLSKSFSQNSKCFCFGTNKGFTVFTSHNSRKNLERALDFEVKMVEILNMTNIFVLVKTELKDSEEKDKMIIWDEKKGRVLVDIIFKDPILNVKIRKDKLFIATQVKIFVFDTNTFRDVKEEIETGENLKGAMAISYSENSILAYPDKENGKIRIRKFNQENADFSIENAHDGKIAYLCLSDDGNLLATASDKGTLIRIFETETGKMIQEVRRGKDEAEIKCICFDKDEMFFAVCSNKGTVHIFALGTAIKNLKEMKEKGEIKGELKILNNEEKSNTTSAFRVLPGFLGGNYFNSEWSFAQVRIKDQNSICTFCSKNNIIIISSEGKYYKAEIDLEKGGEGKIIEEKSLEDLYK